MDQYSGNEMRSFDFSSDGMEHIFPYSFTCRDQRHGATGFIQFSFPRCILPANWYLQKIYIIVWMILLISAIALAIEIASKVIAIFSKGYQIWLLGSIKSSEKIFIGLSFKKRHGMFTTLMYIKRNVSKAIFVRLLEKLVVISEELQNKSDEQTQEPD